MSLLLLGANLNFMRRLRGVGPAQAAAASHVSPDELARWESGQIPPGEKSLRRLMRLYRQPPEIHKVLADWATGIGDDANQRVLTDTAPGAHDRLVALELRAVGVQATGSCTFPPLVRSSAYADSLIPRRSPLMVGLTDPGRWRRPVVTGFHSYGHVDVVLEESLLQQPSHGDPRIHADQLTYLCEVVDKGLADIRIIRTSTGAGTGTGTGTGGYSGDLLGLAMPGLHHSTVWVHTTADSATYCNGSLGRGHQREFDAMSARAEALPLSTALLHQAAAAWTTRGAQAP
ncbi:Scr1 family TA system antitoxin-like transcriptional regulator [Streptomyces sp. TLI_146]|uniref:Scr1 family TA system antitoxin-like transcriptional regulator n=1 Tax=Streptomyces sp. TLI_146 TaxID=1938858 RepID=UPI0015D59DE7|nr:Scr1 family TA system antitoxin-like transcriptional regulator [Streptomyces sp. TLI_146]